MLWRRQCLQLSFLSFNVVMIVQWFYTGCPHAVNPETSDVGRPLARLPSTVHPASVTSCNFSFLILKHMSSKSYLSVSSSWDKFSGDITVRRRTSSLEILSDHLSMHLILNIWRRNQISVACRRAFVFFSRWSNFRSNTVQFSSRTRVLNTRLFVNRTRSVFLYVVI